MKILVLNAGSSSLKYQLFDMEEKTVLAKGLCERIGIDGIVTHKRQGKDDYKANADLKNHKDAISLVLKLITDKELGAIDSVLEIGAVGHRFAHGGEKLRTSTLLGDEEIRYLEEITELNPLHGPHAISVYRACHELMPCVKNVGVFDTSYYSDMPKDAYIYPIPYEFYEKYKIRRYGFHGTSHRYVTELAERELGKKNAKIVSCHLGNGSSVTASVGCRAVDTSMGFTPQDGVTMGTRSGAVDPTVIPFIMKKENISAEEAEKILNSKSGLLGISGISSDLRDIKAEADMGNTRAKLAIDILTQSIKRLIGSYVAEMNGIDALVFTAGIGENAAFIRDAVTENMDYLGIKTDRVLNFSCHGEFADISAKDATVKTFVIPTDEEFMIALDTLYVTGKES